MTYITTRSIHQLPDSLGNKNMRRMNDLQITYISQSHRTYRSYIHTYIHVLLHNHSSLTLIASSRSNEIMPELMCKFQDTLPFNAFMSIYRQHHSLQYYTFKTGTYVFLNFHLREDSQIRFHYKQNHQNIRSLKYLETTVLMKPIGRKFMYLSI